MGSKRKKYIHYLSPLNERRHYRMLELVYNARAGTITEEERGEVVEYFKSAYGTTERPSAAVEWHSFLMGYLSRFSKKQREEIEAGVSNARDKAQVRAEKMRKKYNANRREAQKAKSTEVKRSTPPRKKKR